MRLVHQLSEAANSLHVVRRLFSFLLAPALAASLPIAAALTQTSPQPLISVSGEYGTPATLQRFNITAQDSTPLIATVTLTAIPTTHRVRGIIPFLGSTTSPNKVVVYTETADGISHLWEIDHVAGTATQLCSPLLWGDELEATRPEDMVGMARTPLGTSFLSTLAGQPWHTIIGAGGMCYGPSLDGSASETSGPTSTGGSGSLPIPGPYLGAAQHGTRLLVAAQPGPLKLHRITPPSTHLLLAPGQPPLVLLQSWTIPVTGQLLGWTISSDGTFYGLVNHFVVSDDQTSGYVELVRSTGDIDSSGPILTLQSIGSHIMDWNNGASGPRLLPRLNIALPNN